MDFRKQGENKMKIKDRLSDKQYEKLKESLNNEFTRVIWNYIIASGLIIPPFIEWKNEKDKNEFWDEIIEKISLNEDTGKFEINSINLHKQQNISFEELAKLNIQYLNNNHHPHTRIIVDSTSCEIVEGIKAISINIFLKD